MKTLILFILFLMIGLAWVTSLELRDPCYITFYSVLLIGVVYLLYKENIKITKHK